MYEQFMHFPSWNFHPKKSQQKTTSTASGGQRPPTCYRSSGWFRGNPPLDDQTERSQCLRKCLFFVKKPWRGGRGKKLGEFMIYTVYIPPMRDVIMHTIQPPLPRWFIIGRFHRKIPTTLHPPKFNIDPKYLVPVMVTKVFHIWEIPVRNCPIPPFFPFH